MIVSSTHGFTRRPAGLEASAIANIRWPSLSLGNRNTTSPASPTLQVPSDLSPKSVNQSESPATAESCECNVITDRVTEYSAAFAADATTESAIRLNARRLIV